MKIQTIIIALTLCGMLSGTTTFSNTTQQYAVKFYTDPGASIGWNIAPFDISGVSYYKAGASIYFYSSPLPGYYIKSFSIIDGNTGAELVKKSSPNQTSNAIVEITYKIDRFIRVKVVSMKMPVPISFECPKNISNLTGASNITGGLPSGFTNSGVSWGGPSEFLYGNILEGSESDTKAVNCVWRSTSAEGAAKKILDSGYKWQCTNLVTKNFKCTGNKKEN